MPTSPNVLTTGRPISHRWATVRSELRARRTARAERKDLARELAGYSTPSQRADLDAVLARHDDAATAALYTIMNRRHVA